MKNLKRPRAVFTALFVLSLILVSCPDPTDDPESRLSSFAGTISISPDGSVTVGTLLGASYSGSETGISYQWNKDGKAVSGAKETTYTPVSAGSYTVTLSKTNYNSKTSAAVTVIDAVSVNYDTLAADLAALTGDSAGAPIRIKLDAITISNAPDPVPENEKGWASINSIILAAGKYIILDLSACSFADNEDTVTGKETPTDNDMNIIRDNQYLTGIDLPSSVTVIGYHAFIGCSNLTRVNAVGAVTIGRRTFRNCTALTSVNFPAATTIDDRAFQDCAALTSANFPLVTTIVKQAFQGCAALKTITLGATAPDVDVDCFSGITGNQTVTVKIPQDATGYTPDWVDGFQGKGWNGSAFINESAAMPVTIVIEKIQ